MSNDAKLGLVLGVAIVVVIALVFFRSDDLAARSPNDPVRRTTAWQKPPPSYPSLPTPLASAQP